MNRLMLIGLAIVLSACGDEGNGGSSRSNSKDTGLSIGGVLLCIAVVLVSGNDSCASSAGSGSGGSSGSGSSGGTSYGGTGPGGSGSGGTGSGGTGSSGGSGSGSSTPPVLNNPSAVASVDEIEPNNDLMNSQVPQPATVSDPNLQTGWSINGSANDIDDTRDAFALTPRRAYMYRISLCPPGERACENHHGMDTLTLFWRLLDQDGNEITSSQGSWTNKAHLMLDAGLMYYVVIDAGDTMGASVDYKFYVYESS
jgi:hypothetical protein